MLAVIGYLWLRGRGPVALPAGASLVPEPGIFGLGTPSLSEGLSVWRVEPKEAPELLRLLLGSLARHHRVLVSAPGRSTVPGVRGGPVYRIASGKIRLLTDAVDALHEMNPGNLAVLILGENLDAKALKTYAEALPEGVGGMVVVMEEVSTNLPVLRCQRQDGSWLLRHGEIEILVQETADGFERIS